MNSPVDLTTFDLILGKITDGFQFEALAKNLLCLIIGVDFVPVGGVKDKGIDGLDHTFYQSSDDKTIYQISIESDPRSKVLNTITSLKKNNIKFSRLFYV